ncbi:MULTISPECIES: hypothetical protein [Psychrilyobacter]|uniref:DUF1998 domain-containing protein n=1 Tax=Psychrilyobacter piezotolerans TaxID=2293438 RepID=A0ABX9KJD6_9FUSO|nr:MULTISPECIES: hypothetical protein [Psychrilyobacter]MCS5421728.1 hypothetical protein [Psychrilyobacter sp. S5]NDI77163.1 hypothetical protein [Psychrilyobacter piezotolerans]RDE64155.1 hypothetical protein DV867_04290 [Psychrilyobacter sp. S5]REI42247.1 hypothetical protein DYH56_04290 [Psychrilyobacter piezotolerans]
MSKKMQRSLNQSMYKYLPNAWVDFYDKESRESFVGLVKKWSSQPDHYVNKQRVLDSLKTILDYFEDFGGVVSEFGKINENNFQIKKLNCHEDENFSDIIVELKPLVFVCEKCKKVETYQHSDLYYKHKKTCSCGGKLSQIQLIYSCECGWSDGMTLLPCNNHGFGDMQYKGKFKFTCKKCNYERPMIMTCPQCQKKGLTPRNALDQRHFLPVTQTLIDIVDESEEKLIKEKDDFFNLMIGWWFGGISSGEYNQLIKKIGRTEDFENTEAFKIAYSTLKEIGIPDEQAKEVALKKAKESLGIDQLKKLEELVSSKVKTMKTSDLKEIAISILEYKNILQSKNSLSLDYAQSRAYSNGFITDATGYSLTNENYGIKNSQVSMKVPLVNCSFGYTRVSSDPIADGRTVTIKSFEEKQKRIIYTNKIETEGILLEFDRTKILEWMLDNNFLDNNLVPNLEDDVSAKAWFLDNINPKVSTFEDFSLEQVDKKNAYTKSVYTLIHSISHTFMKEVSTLCGLDKNSLSEYIFPNIPAVFIYCQNSQGLNLGSMQNTFENSYHLIFEKIMEKINKCIFDPICIEDRGACLGCLYINEISCSNFNKNLNRKYLIGYTNTYTKNEDVKGFWE